MEYSLWIHAPGEDPHIRDIFFDKATGNYYTRGACLPPRFHISFSYPDKSKVLREYTNTLGRLADEYELVIGTVCATHLAVLEQDIRREYAEMTKAFQRTPLICSYAFGEYGPSFTSPKSKLHSFSGVVFCLKEKGRVDNGGGGARHGFLDEIVRSQREEINSLQKQLQFFEGSKNIKMQKLTEVCLGVLLCRSRKSLSGMAEQISDSLRTYYKKRGLKPPYPISRNRLIEHLGKLKERAQKLL
ncbi:hypothetical protein [Desulfosediminicola ganghwensis]|uniref:hypothetical protein n=1 Tax=Desulfosediminicola ganghwensis TaxID=2569540 RepID=UPI0010ACDC37|nr:hypothetical protein [Desulfosediminicola ganghwensis]